VGYLNMTVTNFLLSLTVKDFENWLIFGEVMGKSLVSCFLTHSICTRAGSSVVIGVYRATLC